MTLGPARLIDIDGDGSQEIMYNAAPGEPNPPPSPQLVHQSHIDLVDPTNQSVSDYSSLLALEGDPAAIPSYLYLDFNGDGLVDAVEMLWDGQGNLSVRVQFNTGAGFTRPQTFFAWASGGAAMGSVTYRTIDFNHDGRQDVLFYPYVCGDGGCQGVAQLWVAFLDGDTQTNGLMVRVAPLDFALPLGSRQTPIADNAAGLVSQMTVLDVNGDGVDDLAIPNQVPQDGTFQTWLYVRSTVNVENRLLKHIVRSGVLRNGAQAPGERVSVSYAPLSDSSVYTDDDTACRNLSYPLTCARSKLWVVSEIRRSNDGVTDTPAHSSNQATYQYRDSRMDLRGRGFLGFQTIIQNDLKTGTVTTTSYDLSPLAGDVPSIYPTVGQPRSIIQANTYTNTGGVEIVHSDITTNVYVTNFPAGRAHYTYAQITTNTTQEQPVAPVQPSILKQDVVRTFLDENANVYSHGVDRIDGSGDSVFHDVVYANDGTWPQIQSDTITEGSWTAAAPDEIDRVTVRDYDSQWRMHVESRQQPTPARGDPPITATIWYTNEGLPQTVTGAESPQRGGTSRTVSFVYDSLEHAYPISETNALGQQTTFAFHPAWGLLGWRVDPNGVVTRKQYDGFGRLRLSAKLGQGLVTYSYCPNNAIQPDAVLLDDTIQRVLEVHDNNGERYVTELNWLEKPTQKTSFTRPTGEPTVEAFNYDPYDGQLLNYHPPRFLNQPDSSTQLQYDKLRRLISSYGVDRATWTRSYSGLTVTTTNLDDNVVTSIDLYDSRGHVIQNTETHQAVDGTQSPTSTYYHYGPFNTLYQKIDAKGNVTTFEVNSLGGLYHKIDPDSGERYLSYNAYGELETKQTQEYTTTYLYDLLGRKVSDTTGTRVNSFTWDTATNGVGKLASTTSSDGVVTAYAYDWLARPSQKTMTINGESFSMQYQYDDYGRVATLTYPAIPNQVPFTAVYTYAPFGHLSTVSDAADPSTIFWAWQNADASGKFESIRLGAELTEINTPSATRPGRLGEQQVLNNGFQTRYDVTYEYDGRGNVTKESDLYAHTDQTFVYDPMSRLRRWDWNRGYVVTYGNWDYDELGNLTHDKHTAPAVDTVYTYDRSVAGPHQYLYSTDYGPANWDRNGRQTLMNASPFTYNEHDLVSTSAVWSYGITFQYDAAGQRIRRHYAVPYEDITMDELYQRTTSPTTTSYHVLTVRAEGKPVALIKYDLQGSAPRNVTYLNSDRLGSVVLRTEENGADHQRITYSPFGEIADTQADIGPATYTGAQGDFGLYFYNLRAREYFPQMARFHVPDPLVGASSSGQSWNPYSYALNNPATLNDPSGLDPGGGEGGEGGGGESGGDDGGGNGQAGSTVSQEGAGTGSTPDEMLETAENDVNAQSPGVPGNGSTSGVGADPGTAAQSGSSEKAKMKYESTVRAQPQNREPPNVVRVIQATAGDAARLQGSGFRFVDANSYPDQGVRIEHYRRDNGDRALLTYDISWMRAFDTKLRKDLEHNVEWASGIDANDPRHKEEFAKLRVEVEARLDDVQNVLNYAESQPEPAATALAPVIEFLKAEQEAYNSIQGKIDSGIPVNPGGPFYLGLE